MRKYWRTTSRWGKALWVARVSAFSALVGLLLMEFAPQARDVFADTSLGRWPWTLFFLVLFWFWALPVHYGARRVLAWRDWLLPQDAVRTMPEQRLMRLQVLYDRPAKWIPRILAFACFVAILRGLSLASENLEPAQGMPHARTALDQIGLLTIVTWAVFALFVAFIVFRRPLMRAVGILGISGTADYRYNIFSPLPRSRRGLGRTITPEPPYAAVQDDLLWLRYLFGWETRNRHYRDALGCKAKRDLAFDIFAVATIFLVSALFASAFLYPFWLSETLPRAIFLVFMLGAWVLALSYLAAWSHRLKAPLILAGIVATGVLSTFSSHVRDVRYIGTATNGEARQVRLDHAIEIWKQVNCGASACPRPIIIAAQGGASRAGFFTATVIGELLDRTRNQQGRSGSGATKVYADFGERLFAISSVSGSSLGATVVRAALEDAAGRSTDKPETDRVKVERARRFREGPCTRTDARWFDDRSLKLGYPANWRDCLQAVLSGDFLSPVFVGLAFRDHISITFGSTEEPLWPNRATLLEKAWEDHYARLVDNGADLSSTRGFTPSRRLADRFGYAGEYIGRPGQSKGWMPLLFLNGSSVTTGRRIIVSDVQPWYCGEKTPAEHKAAGPEATGDDKISGRPGAAVRAGLAGRPGIAGRLEAASTSDPTKSAAKPEGVPHQLYHEAYDFFELRGSATGLADAVPRDTFCMPDAKVDGFRATRALDIGMSTAATVSARFPIISPHGVIRNLSGEAIDHVVDGGYFENDGLVTARDIARALFDAGLRPIVVRITNDPVPAPTEQSEGQKLLVRHPPPQSGELGWISSLLTPITGLYNTRSGHGSEAAYAVLELFAGDRSPDYVTAADFLEIRVYDRLPDSSVDSRTCERRLDRVGKPASMTEISMSWWLSQPVQEYLDAQLCHPKNQRSLDILKCKLLKDEALGKSCIEDLSKPQSRKRTSRIPP